MAINYEDERLKQVEEEKAAKVSESNRTYDDMIDAVDDHYNAQIAATKDWEEKQTQLQNEQTDLTVERIEQEKQQTEKDYITEQSAAYADWQKQSNPYGVNAEKMAANGMTGTGFSESSQVSMYNTYQNRVAVAKASYDSAVQSFTNAIKEAQIQNSAALAEIYFTSFQQQLELSLEGFQHKNSLILEKADKQEQIESTYDQRYQDVLEQIKAESTQVVGDDGEESSLFSRVFGDSSVDTKGIWETIEDWFKKVGEKSGDATGDTTETGLPEDVLKGITSYDQAASFLRTCGVTDLPMNEKEWHERRAAHAWDGLDQEAAIRGFNNYAEYVQAYIRYCLAI